ncbi:chemotaxis protein CheY [Sorangium cellulosum]|uniref:Chemotaxis protein CheY n=1 Tax=Sorangium cellulosum TaxID=56 RepID=A0A2L0F1P3_SORCE|nr:response regulator [Sorangium cellulosum]AUX45475.1 chemotaxis protein CheY [Sorangium cellulosum]
MITILLVEDNEMNRDMLSRRLVRRGYAVMTAVDGESGVDMARSTRPQLILMDVGLPNIDGLEATRRLKEDTRTRDIPIIVLTAHAMNGDKAQAIEAGGDDYDIKPVEIERLAAKIQTLLGRASQ